MKRSQNIKDFFARKKSKIEPEQGQSSQSQDESQPSASAVHIESPSTSHTHQGVSSAEVLAGHPQGDSGVGASYSQPGPIESGEDSCDEGPSPSHMQHSGPAHTSCHPCINQCPTGLHTLWDPKGLWEAIPELWGNCLEGPISHCAELDSWLVQSVGGGGGAEGSGGGVRCEEFLEPMKGPEDWSDVFVFAPPRQDPGSTVLDVLQLL
ncbi:uncharacterized protein LOC119788021 [Cyprinodon tularosa]|uniref:uncharacterized protein LOC119788021 n=1 Tax=Cyprinodon tularosa TaxID=77115 RepID=UPI0018E22057|nr:uncharacterized protein LOC119788021 [Cyprinodon tularosa]